VTCTGGEESYASCEEGAGLIGCNKGNNKCPAFFQNGATKTDDMVSGWVCLVVAMFVLILCLIGLVAILRAMLLGASTRIIYKATNINPILAMIVGTGVTVLVQSSSITTSTLIPLAGVGVLHLEQIYPLTLGADIGTTFTALMAAMVSSNLGSLQIALSHLFFNLTGIAIWYPIPFMRHFVMNMARRLGKITRHWRSFPIPFIAVMYFLLPLLILGISTCFEKGTAGFTALGVFLLLLIFGGIAYFWFWWSCKSGKESCRACIRRRQRKSAAIKALADDMDFLKVDMEYCTNEIGRLKDFAGLPRTDEEGGPPQEPEEEVLPTEEDEAVSLYESCQSTPWRNVLVNAAGSIQSDLQGSTRMHHRRGSSLQGSARRHHTLQSSTRTHASARRSAAGLQGSNRSSRRGG
jgi:sodium-dependent phosphate cotransporter